MAEFSYAKGRVEETLAFIASEMKEFDKEYSGKAWADYQKDARLQKLMERTVENILTALVELCGAHLADKGIAAENYSQVLVKTGENLGFTDEEQKRLAGLAVQRNRLAHRYLDFKWQAIGLYEKERDLIRKLLEKILELRARE